MPQPIPIEGTQDEYSVNDKTGVPSEFESPPNTQELSLGLNQMTKSYTVTTRGKWSSAITMGAYSIVYTDSNPNYTYFDRASGTMQYHQLLTFRDSDQSAPYYPVLCTTNSVTADARNTVPGIVSRYDLLVLTVVALATFFVKRS